MSDLPVLDAAEQYASLGLCVLPISADGSKYPPIKWQPYQDRLPTARERDKWFNTMTPIGIAIIAGAISGNVEVLDFDVRAAFDQWVGLCEDHDLMALIKRGVLVGTPSGGRHLYYRYAGIVPGPLKLAWSEDHKILIETRGEGTIALVPPTPAACHPDNKPYVFIHGTFDNLPVFTEQERAALHRMALICNEYIEPEKYVGGPARPMEARGGLPGDDYNARGDHLALLERYGWTRCGRDGHGELWTRPGKERGVSATTRDSTRGFYVFSSNAHPFETEKVYSPFAVYASLEHGGDWSRAAKQLYKDGYGERSVRSNSTRLESFEPVGAKAPSPFQDIPEEALLTFDGDDSLSLELLASVDKDLLDGEGNKGPSDLTLAIEWADFARDKFAFVEGDQWYAYDDGRWHYSSASMARKSLQDFLERKRQNGAKITLNATKVRGVMFLAESKLGPRALAEFDARPGWIGMRNGVFDIVSGTLMQHKPEHMLTYQAPYEHSETAECPRWLQFLEEVLLRKDKSFSDEWASALQEWFGLALLPTPAIQAAHYWVGDGSNGKGVATRVLQNLVGSEFCCALPIEQLDQDYHKAQLHGKRVGLVNEPDPRAMKKNASHFKAITGGDLISARRPTEKVFSFVFQGRIILSCNELPSTKDLSAGYFRRVVLIEWRNNIPAEKRDMDLDEKLKMELPGIFNWAIEGLRRVRSNGKLTSSEESATLLEGYKRNEDVLGRFFEDCCVIDKSIDTAISDVYQAYKKWSTANGEYVQSNHKIAARLEKIGCERYVKRIKTPGENAWRSIKSWRGIALQSA